MNHFLAYCVALLVLQGCVKAFILTSNSFRQLHPSTAHIFNKASTSPDEFLQVLTPENCDALSKSSASDKEAKERKKSRLKFGGKFKYESKSFPVPLDLEHLHYFFSMKDTERVLLSGGRNITQVEYLSSESLDRELKYFTRWEKEAKMFGGEAPSLHDSLVRVIPSVIKILSVEVFPESVIGTKFLRKDSLPEFQAILIDDTPTAKGPMPLVHLFNLIVNAGSKKNRSESAFLRLWVKMADDTTATFIAESEMYLEFTFPSLLLKLFPINKEKAESICSSAILNALEVNMVPAIDCLYDKYLKFSQTHEKSPSSSL